MPELPEVEKARHLLGKLTAGSTWSVVNTTSDDIVYVGISHAEFADCMRGQTIASVERYGKWFYFCLADDITYVFLHFGMTGCLRVRNGEGVYYRSTKARYDDTEWPPKYYKFAVDLSSGTQFAFCDARRLARIRVVKLDKIGDDIKMHQPLSQLGFDPYLCMPDKGVFADMVGRKKCVIKALLLDQAFSAGIGNWIADEVLFQAHIHPESIACAVPRTYIDALHDAIVTVIRLACEANLKYAKFPDTWLFHHRWSKGSKSKGAPKMPDGRKIEFVTVGGRTSAVVVGAQKRFMKPGSAVETLSDQQNNEYKDISVADVPPKRSRSVKERKAIETIMSDSDLSSLDEDPQHPPDNRIELVTSVSATPPRKKRVMSKVKSKAKIASQE